MLETTLGVAIAVALLGYALSGGADFGGGVWDLLAFGPRALRQRAAIARALGPIWEANHVWLIVVIVLLFTAFPPAFAALMTTLHIPLTLMLIGIVLRGSAFVFRTYDAQDTRHTRRWSLIFAISSSVTPVMLGICAGTVAAGRVRLDPRGGPVGGFVAPWLSAFPVAIGLLTLALFAMLGAVYLTVELKDEPDLQEDFRRRALGAAGVVGVCAALAFALSGTEAPALRLALAASPWSLGFHAATAMAALGVMGALGARRYNVARLAAMAQVALIIGGWLAAQHPWLLPGAFTLADAKAPDAVLRPVVWTLGLGSLLVVPAFAALYRLFKGDAARLW